jgi:hypothetical protein
MRRTLGLTLLAFTFAVMAGTASATASTVTQPTKSCTRNAYAYSCGTKIPANGAFSIKIPGSPAKLIGQGSKKTAGVHIRVAKVTAPDARVGGDGIKISATGSFSPLHLSKGKIYRYNASSGKASLIKKVKAPGIYQVLA